MNRSNDKELIVTVQEATDKIINSIKPLGKERLGILDAVSMVIYEDLVSDIDIPSFDNSAMDGYAIIAEDTKVASVENPVKLRLIDEIQAGGSIDGKKVTKGTAIQIMTGAPLPAGADAVIQFEDTVQDTNTVSIQRQVKEWENCRFAGEDIKKGSTVLNKGDRVSSADVGLLASLGFSTIDVYKRPEVAIISTGDEVVDIGEPLEVGQIRNSNFYSLHSEVKRYSAIPRYLGIAKDTKTDTKDIIKQGFESDIVITTGGVSMGKYDFVKEVILDLGVDIKFEWIRMKPGRPCIFGTKEDKLFFGLPGNPVSTMISFIQFVRPAILKIMGAKKIRKPVIEAILEEDIKKKPDRTNFIRGIFSINRQGVVTVKTTGPQGSGILMSMSEANCLIILPIGIDKAKKGEKVSVQLIFHEEIE